MFGIFFYLLKTHDSSRQSDQSWKTVESGVTGSALFFLAFFSLELHTALQNVVIVKGLPCFL